MEVPQKTKNRNSLAVQWFGGFAGGTGVKNEFRRRRRHRLDPWVGKIPLEYEMATHSSILA